MDKFAIEYLPEDELVREDLENESRDLCEDTKAQISSDKGFYVGDICYALPEEIYQNIWGKKYKFADGIMDVGNGLKFAVASTAYGDGNFESEDGTCGFPVDAGNIGLVPLELVEDEQLDDLEYCGYVCEDAGNASLVCDDGYFTITLPNEQFSIDTAWDNNDGDEDYYNDNWVDDEYTGM